MFKIKSPIENNYSGADQTRTSTIIRGRKNEHPLLTGHTLHVLFVTIGKNREKPLDNLVIYYCLAISMKKSVSVCLLNDCITLNQSQFFKMRDCQVPVEVLNCGALNYSV